MGQALKTRSCHSKIYVVIATLITLKGFTSKLSSMDRQQGLTISISHGIILCFLYGL